MPYLNEVVFASSNKSASKRISQQLKSGQLRKIAPRIYTSNLIDAPERIILRNWFKVLSHLFPKAILSHRSAVEAKPVEGHIFLTYTSTRNVLLPGLTVHLLEGPDSAISTNLFFENLYRSSEARMFLENMQPVQGTTKTPKTLKREILEGRLESIIRTRGDQALNTLRDEAKLVAIEADLMKEFDYLNKLISALLSTHPSKILNSDVAKARASGEPFDPERIDLFGSLYDYLSDKELKNHQDLNTSESAYNSFAFFESYFSNFIEGTEFEIEEAKEIIRTETPMPLRDEDSHDILGTYQVVSNRKEMEILPVSAEHLTILLRERHKILLRARTSKNPGQFKDRNNRAGNTEFVDWKLVAGTLKKGYELYSLLRDPFAKACYIMFLVSEVHPFLDGNGRIARVMMNAELSAKGLSKILIPTVYRIDYIGAIKKLTKTGKPETYINMLSRAYEFSANVHGEGLEEVEAYLRNCNAFETDEDYILRF